MEESNKYVDTREEDDSIDFMELLAKAWTGKWTIVKVTLLAAVVGIVVALSIPREYTSSSKFAPENATEISGNSNAITALTGIRIGAGSSPDALTPNLYPDIISSTPFLLELIATPVDTRKSEHYPTLYDYIANGQKSAWWNYIFNVPGYIIGGVKNIFRGRDEVDSKGIDPYKLSEKQQQILSGLSDRIGTDLDDKNGTATISVRMQDPYISALVADSVVTKLQRYITVYRTEKARNDLEFSRQIYDEAAEAYAQRQQEYARFVDRNKDVILQSYRAEQERLFNEATLAYNLYNQAAQNLAAAQSKLQEKIPVFTIIEPVSVPPKASSPRKAMIVIVFAFLGGLLSLAWVMFGRDMTDDMRTRLRAAKPESALSPKAGRKRRKADEPL